MRASDEKAPSDRVVGQSAISVEKLGKEYVIGGKETSGDTFREMVSSIATAPFRRLKRLSGHVVPEERLWALRDVSFEVNRGEVVGIIGRNGSGKSTLLKVLSRITAPSEGRVEVRGRMASLLEVGTGFHPELTGRENIYLNGAILGMARAEITAKFDTIVDFAGIEKFLDTPVKRYSSGMQVRLAFAVGAHLDPDILLVDEVLAVGDMEFQKRCLGKMRSVATKDQRTVLFVSHNLQAIESLCDRVILLRSGRIEAVGETRAVISHYLSQNASHSGEKRWSPDNAPGDSDIKLLAVRVLTPQGEPSGTLSTKDDLFVEFDFNVGTKLANLCIGFDLMSIEGLTLFRTYQTDLPTEHWPALKEGQNRWRCKIPGGLLNGGEFVISPRIGIHKDRWIVLEDAVLQFEMLLDHGVSPLWNTMTARTRPGLVSPLLEWESLGQ